MREKKDVRLFFALWPDDEVRAQIVAILNQINLDRVKCRLVKNSNLHLTLHFIGNTSIAEMKCLDLHARGFDAESFEFTLDCSGYFKKPKVFWIGCQAVPQALFDLHRNLAEQISQCAYKPETRPYSPHMTVARKFTEVPGSIPFEPVLWQVDRFVLVKSVSVPGGVRYEVAESYSLI
jgi:2'-5' RNA ligase